MLSSFWEVIKINCNDFKSEQLKQRIFEKAVELFSATPYDSVTINDIANKVGTDELEIYSHFKSKQEILDMVYSYYKQHFTGYRPSQEEIDPIIKYGSLIDIFNCTNYTFKEEYEETMILCHKIILYRSFTDEAANDIMDFISEENLKFVESVFERAVQLGRLAPFDIHSMSVLCCMSRFIMLIRFLTDRSRLYKFINDEQLLYASFAKGLIDLADDGFNNV